LGENSLNDKHLKLRENKTDGVFIKDVSEYVIIRKE
jgi:hypothetical protein